MNYFLIKDSCRDGDHEYYDEVVVETKMTHKNLRENKNFWEECFLAWQFHHIEQDSNDDWWAGLRIVSIYDFKSITKKLTLGRLESSEEFKEKKTKTKKKKKEEKKIKK